VFTFEAKSVTISIILARSTSLLPHTVQYIHSEYYTGFYCIRSASFVYLFNKFISWSNVQFPPLILVFLFDCDRIPFTLKELCLFATVRKHFYLILTFRGGGIFYLVLALYEEDNISVAEPEPEPQPES
jgi:hypothetical protein